MPTYRCPSERRFGVVLSAVIVAVSLAGCGPAVLDLPKVKGVVRAKGGNVLTGGMIEFRDIADPNKRSTGGVSPEGTFELTTGDANVRHPGAHPGEYEVSVYEPVTFGKRSAAKPITVPPEGLESVEVVVGEPVL